MIVDLAVRLWVGAGCALLVAGGAMLGDRRRARRRDLDRVGWVPWPTVLVLALIGAAVCVALALQVRR